MKLPLNMLLHELQEGLLAIQELEMKDALFHRPTFFQAKGQNEGCILYEGDGRTVFEEIGRHAVLICNSWSKTIPKKRVILLKPEYTVRWASNVLHGLFDRWNEWEVSIQECLYQKPSLHDLLDISVPYFGVPLTIMNRDFQLIAIAGEKQYFRKHHIYAVQEGEKLPREQVNQFKLDPEYLGVEQRRDPFLWPPSILLPFPSLCMNLFYNDTYCARVVMFSEGWIDPWKFYLLEQLVSYLEVAYMLVANFPGEITETVQILKNLLSEHGATTQETMRLLSFKGWEHTNRYQIVLFQLSAQDIANGTVEYFRQELSKRFPFGLSVVKDQQIVLLVNLSVIQEEAKEFRQRVSLFIRDENFRVGFSNIFTGIDHLYYYYQQAEIALRYGNRNNPMIWQHHFDDYAFSYFLDKGYEDLSPTYLKPKELLILQEYDQKNKTELYQTLKSYLKNGESAVKTSKELFVQRGTILYRISRIEQLTGINWDDYQRKVFLSLAFVMEERVENGGSVS